MRRIICSALVIAVLAAAGAGEYFATSAASQASTPPDWKTYRSAGVLAGEASDTYGFTIQYPPFFEPMEGKAQFFFPVSNAPVWLNLCFAPTTRNEFYCEVELYVVPYQLVPYSKGMPTFLDLPLCRKKQSSCAPSV